MSSGWMFLACVVLLLLASGAVAEPGTTAIDVFAFGNSARFDALAAGVSLPGDASSLVRNPATLEDIDRTVIAVNYQDWYVDTWVGHAGFASPGPWLDGAFGVDLVYFSEGETEDVDPLTGSSTGSYENGHLGLAAGYGFALPWARTVDAGFSVQVSNRTLLGESAGSFAVGGGLAAGVWDDALRIGLSARNLGTGVSFADGSPDPAPWCVSGGLSVAVPGVLPESVELVLCADLVKTRAANVGYTIGAEVSVFDAFWVRAGYDDTVSDARMRYGLGACVGLLEIDYAYVNHEVLGSASSVSVTWRPEHR